MRRYKLPCLTFLALQSFAALSFDQCIQSKGRIDACPHKIIRSIKVAPSSEHYKKIYCICISDFKALMKPPQNDVEKILQRDKWRDIKIDHGFEKEDFLKLLRGY